MSTSSSLVKIKRFSIKYFGNDVLSISRDNDITLNGVISISALVSKQKASQLKNLKLNIQGKTAAYSKPNSPDNSKPDYMIITVGSVS